MYFISFNNVFFKFTGAISSELPIIPAVKRSMGKLGTNPQPGGRNPTQLAAIDAMRFYSLAEMFAGKVPAIADLFKACAERNARKAGKYASEQLSYHNEYTEVGRSFGEGQHSLASIAENFSSRSGEAPSVDVQTRALASSLEVDKVDPTALAKLEVLAQDCQKDEIDHMSCYLQLPAELKADAGAN